MFFKAYLDLAGREKIENHHISYSCAFKVSHLGFPPFIVLEVPGQCTHGLCASLVGAEGSHQAEGELGAPPEFFPCRALLLNLSNQVANPDKKMVPVVLRNSVRVLHLALPLYFS